MNDSILTPQFSLTPAIRSALDDIERQSWLINNMLLMPRHEAWIRREVQVRRAAGTTRIEGAKLDEAEVSKLINKAPAGRVNEDEQANINALQAYKFIDFVSDQSDIPIDELVIRQINREFMAGAPDTLTPGAYRRGLNRVGNYTPPDQGDVPSLMRAFALWLRGDNELHPVIRAAIAHIHLVAIHPFWDGNGRTARGLTTVVLQRSQYGVRKLLSLESYMFDVRDEYFTAIERTLGTHFSPDYDATRWLEFFTSALKRHVEQLTAQLTDWHRKVDALHRQVAPYGVDPRQADAILYLHRTGRITRSDYMEITGVSASTASRNLAEFVKAGLLIPEGKTRSRVYRPVPIEPEQAREQEGAQLPLV